MKKMKHILRSIVLLPVLAGALAVSCNKTAGEGPNVALKRQFDAWKAIHYPDAVEKDGVYVIEDTPGTGLEWNENLPVTFLQYTIRALDGTVSYTGGKRNFNTADVQENAISGISDSVMADTDATAVFDLAGRRAESPAKGIYIVRRGGQTRKVVGR